MRKMQMRGAGIAFVVAVLACLCGGCGDDHNSQQAGQKAIMKYNQEANVSAAKCSVMSINEAVVTYRLKNNGRLPNSLRDFLSHPKGEKPILEGGEKALIDPWGNEYKLEKNGSRHAILSAGPDGIFYTEDDIRSDRSRQRK